MDDLEEKINKTQEANKKVKDILDKKIKEISEEKDTLSNLATLGIMTVAFSHEVLEKINFTHNNSLMIKDNFDNGLFELLSPHKEKFEKSIDRIISNSTFVKSFSKFALENVKFDKRKRKNIYVNLVAKNVFDSLELLLKNHNIKVDMAQIPDRIKPIRGYIIDWESIFVNLITNSITALEKKLKKSRHISLIISENNEDVIINFADSGCGLEAATEYSIFKPMTSTKRDKKGNVVGTGMGLSIVKTFVEDHSQGTIEVSSKGRLGGAEFIIRIPVVRGN